MDLTLKLPTDCLPSSWVKKMYLFVIALGQLKCDEFTCPHVDAVLYADRSACYWYTPGPFNYTQAKTNCEAENGHLATLYDSPTSTFVVNSVFGGNCQTAYLGITRNPVELWVTWDSLTIPWSNWATTPWQYPNGPGNCVKFGKGCIWRNKDCSTELDVALCESEGILVSAVAPITDVFESTLATNIQTQTDSDQTGSPESSTLDGSTIELSIISTSSSSETSSHDISTSTATTTQLGKSEGVVLTTLALASTVRNDSQGTSSATFSGVSEVTSSTTASLSGASQQSAATNVSQSGDGRHRNSNMRDLTPRMRCQKTKAMIGTNTTSHDNSQQITKLNKKSMNKDRRRYHSAADSRASSTAMGAVGVFVICVIACLFISLDIATFIIERKH